MSSELVDSFRQVTGADEETALSFLSACNNNLDTAVSLYMDEPRTADEYRSPIPQRTEQLLPTLIPHYPIHNRTFSSRGHRRAFAIEESDESDSDNDRPSSHNAISSPTVSSNGRMSEIPDSVDLVDSCGGSLLPPPESSSSAQYAKAHRKVNGNQVDTTGHKRGRLRQLFQPPTELLFVGSLSAAQKSAREKNQWLLTTLHDEGCFDCHVLNRDVWKDPRIYQLIKRNFTFIQIAVDNSDGIAYRSRHSYVQGASHIAIHDPTTGEQKVMWTHLKDPNSVYEILSEFLRKSSTPLCTKSAELSCSSSYAGQRRPPDNHTNEQHILDRPLKRLRLGNSADDESPGVSGCHVENSVAGRSAHPVDPLDLTEDEQLQLAIRASQQEAVLSMPDRDNAAVDFQSSPIILTDDDDEESSLSSNSDECRIIDTAVNSTTAIISARRPLRLECGSSFPGPVPSTDLSCFTLPTPDPGESVFELVIRFPSGSREHVLLPASMKLITLRYYLESRGFPHSQFELIRLYPYTSLSKLSPKLTLDQIGLAKRDTVFLQER